MMFIPIEAIITNRRFRRVKVAEAVAAGVEMMTDSPAVVLKVQLAARHTEVAVTILIKIGVVSSTVTRNITKRRQVSIRSC